MMNLLSVLINALKAKVIPAWTRIKLWTNWSFIRTRAVTWVRVFFTKTLSVRPRGKKDYYPLFGWLVSKRLAFAAVMVAGIFSLYYVCIVSPVTAFTGESGRVRSYDYDSLALRFITGKVNIRAKSGYIAYEGDVKKGKVSGNGSLYSPAREIIYTGMFEDNQYNGTGRLYYEGQQLAYSGTFEHNLFEGSGVLYRKNAAREYEGAFSLGMKEGDGTLYDSSDNKIYEGRFSHDRLLYSDLLGKKTSDVAKSYTGKRVVYSDGEHFVVSMDDIDALYCADSGEGDLDGAASVGGVYVLSGSIRLRGKECRTIRELSGLLGEVLYEGNSKVTMPEAVAIQYLCERGNTELGRVDLICIKEFSDVREVIDYEPDSLIYLYAFRDEGLTYTFFSRETYGEFSMYLIEKEERE